MTNPKMTIASRTQVRAYKANDKSYKMTTASRTQVRAYKGNDKSSNDCHLSPLLRRHTHTRPMTNPKLTLAALLVISHVFFNSSQFNPKNLQNLTLSISRTPTALIFLPSGIPIPTARAEQAGRNRLPWLWPFLKVCASACHPLSPPAPHYVQCVILVGWWGKPCEKPRQQKLYTHCFYQYFLGIFLGWKAAKMMRSLGH